MSQWGHSRLNQELHQPGVPTGGSSMQWCPQLTVTGVHAGTGIQQALHHLHKVINAALGESAHKQMYTERLVLFSMITQGNDYVDSCIRQHLHARPGPLLCKHAAFQEGEQRLPILQRLLCAHE